MSFFNVSVKNTIFNSIGFVWPIIISLIFTPYIVKNLGDDAYGIMGLTGLLWGYFALLDMGLGSGNIKYVSEYIATKKYEKINAVINSLLLIYIFLGSFGLIIIFTLSAYFTKTVFNIPSDYIGIGIFAFEISAFGFFISTIKPVFDGIPKALNRFDIYNKINIVFGTLSTLSVVAVLYLGFGLKEVLIVKLFINIIIFVTTIFVSKRLLPFYKFQFIIEKSIFKMLFNYGVWEMFIKLANLAISTLGSLIISIMLGPAALTYYLLPQNLTRKINGFNYKVSEILFPISSELSSTNSYERLNSIYLKMSKYTLAFKLSLYVPIIFYSYEILYFWLGKEFADKGWLVMVFLGFGFFINSSAHLAGLITYGTAKLKITSYYTAINFIVLVLTMYPFIKFWGITGAALSYFISTIVFVFYLFQINKKLLKIDFSVYIKNTLIKPFIVAFLMAIVCFVTKFLVTNLIILLSVLFIVFILFNFISYLINIYEKNDVQRVFYLFKNGLKNE